jgi:hypothetical protein
VSMPDAATDDIKKNGARKYSGWFQKHEVKGGDTMKKSLFMILVFLGLVTLPGLVGAALVPIDQLTFNAMVNQKQYGTLNYAGGNTVLTTTNTPVSTVVFSALTSDGSGGWYEADVYTLDLRSGPIGGQYTSNTILSMTTLAHTVSEAAWTWNGGTMSIDNGTANLIKGSLGDSVVSKGGGTSGNNVTSVLTATLDPTWYGTVNAYLAGLGYELSSTWTGTMNLQGNFVNPNGVKISPPVGNGFKLQINSPSSVQLNPVPIPPTVLLLGGALMCMVIARKRLT